MGKRLSPYVSDTERKITDLGLRDSSVRMLPQNSVILSSRAPIGHLVINTEPMGTNQGCKGLIPRRHLLPQARAACGVKKIPASPSLFRCIMNEITIYQTENGNIEVRLEQETVWLTQRQMAGVLETTPENVLMHLKNIYADDELQEAATTMDFLVVAAEGKRQVRRNLKHYNLDAVISVGYRVNSRRAVTFRQWATRLLREHLTHGYTLNRQRFEANARELEAALRLVKKAARIFHRAGPH
jgi:hypothetical protein